MPYIQRAMEQTFKQLSSEYPAVLLTGPRQTGKTTMLEKLMKEENVGRTYVTLDDLNDREMAKNDPKAFFQINKPPILIDEAQYAPELFPYIKIHIDKNHNAGDFWITGSQVFRLMRGVQESLAGRMCLLTMHSLSQSEIYGLQTQPFELNIDKLAERAKTVKSADINEIYGRVFNGGMPALISKKYTDRRAFYSSYVSTYIDRDVRDISGTVDSLKFLRFITAAAALTGQMLNIKTLADASQIDQQQAKAWLSILETLGIIFYLHPYSNNVLKRTVSKPRLYFHDTGLVAHLIKWNSSETLMNGAMSGAILENFAVAEIIKSYHNCGIEPCVYYYRDKDAKEIDVIMESDGKLYPIEIKKTSTPAPQLIRVFNVINKSPYIRSTGAVLCTSDKLSAFNSDNLIVPIWLV
ncbi:MAG: ATP-binding protein [Oscillospiraceae bacterium]|nr:ATP-binding protein [Oscillospiraceae bacterium]